jgi:hypothetical protein
MPRKASGPSWKSGRPNGPAAESLKRDQTQSEKCDFKSTREESYPALLMPRGQEFTDTPLSEFPQLPGRRHLTHRLCPTLTNPLEWIKA